MATHADSATNLPPHKFPIFTTIASYREWRGKAFEDKKSVGFVATMGALHEGHASLVRHSLAENDLTVVSIFVNPAQFAPHEDLATYPRTLEHDLKVLNELEARPNTELIRTPSALFLPNVYEMYPSGISQDLNEQKGTFVEVKGFSHQMEGKTRPNFFRGVATVVTKLFNIIQVGITGNSNNNALSMICRLITQPSRTYFGQKDIQQALLLRRMTRDLLLPHPEPENLHIVPIARDPASHLALSSRNAYLTPSERNIGAPTLYAALNAAQEAWIAGKEKKECIRQAEELIRSRTEGLSRTKTGQEEVRLKLDYIEMNDPDTFDVIGDLVERAGWEKGHAGRPVVLSGAMWVGETRLIDNIILGDAKQLGILTA
ncbi:hypothetical protein EIP86_009919 [Pleurotus ostreatoroseus]|nr:hypothetical protein EIP86_009919 [Pleurotus ostreatoroseus]